jgi:hypothetical protein
MKKMKRMRKKVVFASLVVPEGLIAKMTIFGSASKKWMWDVL